jgi:hypothetical protein
MTEVFLGGVEFAKSLFVKSCIPVMLVFALQVAWAGPGSSFTPSFRFASGSVCEVLLQSRDQVMKWARVFHARIMDHPLIVTEVTPEPELLRLFALDSIKPADLEGAKLKFSEADNGYVLQLEMAKGLPIDFAPISVPMPPLYAWFAFNVSKREVDKAVKDYGEDLLQPPDDKLPNSIGSVLAADESYRPFLEIRGYGEDVGYQIVLGAYVPCRSRLAKSYAQSFTQVRTDIGWRCKVHVIEALRDSAVVRAVLTHRTPKT